MAYSWRATVPLPGNGTVARQEYFHMIAPLYLPCYNASMKVSFPARQSEKQAGGKGIHPHDAHQPAYRTSESSQARSAFASWSDDDGWPASSVTFLPE